MQMSYLYASDCPFKNFCKLPHHAETILKNVREKSNDAYSLSIRVHTAINHIAICTFSCFFIILLLTTCRSACCRVIMRAPKSNLKFPNQNDACSFNSVFAVMRRWNLGVLQIVGDRIYSGQEQISLQVKSLNCCNAFLFSLHEETMQVCCCQTKSLL